MPLVPLRGLNKSGDVPVCVFDRRNQFPTTNILDLLLCLRASTEEELQTMLNVGHLPVAHRPRHAFVMAMGI